MKKRRHWLWILVMLISIALVSACGGMQRSDSTTTDGDTASFDASPEMADSKAEPMSGDGSAASASIERGEVTEEALTVSDNESDGGTVSNAVVPEDRQVIYRAQMSIQVEDFQASRTEIETLVEQAGGYMVKTSQYEEDYKIGGFLTVRVPQETFSEFLEQVEDLADKVQNRQISGSDVTEEYVDLKSRLKAKQTVEKRLLQFMEEAEKTEDLLKISTELGNIQEDIEQLTGRITYLEDQVALSTVEIDITQPIVERAVSGKGERHTIAAAWNALIASVDGVLGFLSGLVVFLAASLPVLILLLIVAIPLWIWWRIKGRALLAKRKESDPRE